MRSKVFLFFFAVSIFVTYSSFAHAQSSAGIELKPSALEQGAEAGQVIDQVFSLTNISDREQTYYLLTKDISGASDTGAPIFADPGAEVTGYELSTWVSYTNDPIVIKPHSTVDVPVKISVPTNATPGSHFGALFATVDPPRLRESGAGVGYEVGALISIRIAGDALESARIREFSTEKLLNSSVNVKFLVRVENPGKVLIRPHGPLEITNMFGKRVGFLTVNDSLAGVFPGDTRAFNAVWQSDELAFGRYQAIVGLAYGDPGHISTVSGTVSFWVLPIKVLGPVFGGLAFLILTIYLSVKFYIRRALELSTTQGRRMVARQRRDTGVSRLMVVAVTLLLVTVIFLVALLFLFA